MKAIIVMNLVQDLEKGKNMETTMEPAIIRIPEIIPEEMVIPMEIMVTEAMEMVIVAMETIMVEMVMEAMETVMEVTVAMVTEETAITANN